MIPGASKWRAVPSTEARVPVHLLPHGFRGAVPRLPDRDGFSARPAVAPHAAASHGPFAAGKQFGALRPIDNK